MSGRRDGRRGSARPAAPKPAAPKPAAPKPAGPKPAAPKPAGPKPAGPKPAAPKPAGPKPAAPKPAGPKPAAPKPGGRKPAASKPATGRPAAASGPGRDFDDDDEDWGFEPGERDSLTDVPGGVRLQKVLAAAGVGSRRSCEELIGAGRVEVDGEVVRRFGARVDPRTQIIRVDGKRIPASEDLVYLALNKPAGVLSTMSDDRGRRTIADLVADRSERLFHVGRLDYETEGLILLTNDGELAHRLAHPRYGVLKTYLAEVRGPVPRDLARRLTTGVELEDGTVTADRFRVVEQAGSRVLVEITLHEGRKHVVRRMLAEVGHPVSRLVRTRVGPVSLGALRPGTSRRLSTAEVGNLYAAVGM